MSDYIVESSNDYARREIARIEAQNRTLAFRLSVAESQRALPQNPAFRLLLDRLAQLRDTELMAMANQRMDEYELGLRQGLIRAIDKLDPATPPSDEQIAQWKTIIEESHQRLVELNRTLEIGTGVASGA